MPSPAEPRERPILAGPCKRCGRDTFLVYVQSALKGSQAVCVPCRQAMSRRGELAERRVLSKNGGHR
jgi:hypothetical protein